MPTLLLNYSHPLAEMQLAQLTALLGEVPEVRMVGSQIDRTRPIADIARALAEAAGLSADEWQTTPVVLNPPALAPLPWR